MSLCEVALDTSACFIVSNDFNLKSNCPPNLFDFYFVGTFIFERGQKIIKQNKS